MVYRVEILLLRRHLDQASDSLQSFGLVDRSGAAGRAFFLAALRLEGERFEHRRSSQPRPKLGPYSSRERIHPEQNTRKIIEVWDEERPALRAMPAAFDGFVEDTGRISPTCLVNFERNRYGVECRYVGRVATVRACVERVVLMCSDQMIGVAGVRWTITPGTTCQRWTVG